MSTEPGAFAEIFGQILFTFSRVQPLLPTYTHLILSALFPIYAGAHASLSRPSTAAKPAKKKRRADTSEDGDSDGDEDDGEDESRQMEGLSPSDALMFPVLAGCALAGLYFLIKWLKDPAVLNKILNWYFAIFGIVSVARMLADGLELLGSLLFPTRYVADGVLWQISESRRAATPAGKDPQARKPRKSPLPGSLLPILPLPRRANDLLWVVREILRQKWSVQIYIHHVVDAKTHIGICDVLGAGIAFTASMYYNLIDKPWWLTNLFGFGFCYGSIQLMSPTTFATGGLLLSALFFYDVYFVFYTPMMITVATTLDIPIKLLFPRPPSPDAPLAQAKQRLHAMLGLGDIVLPGIMMGLALRFDLYMFYLRQQKPAAIADGPTSRDVVKAVYKPVTRRRGDDFWTHALVSGRPLTTKSDSKTAGSDDESKSGFPKPYFHATLAGYILGLLTTLVFMHIYEHGQPALLYLVPGVLGALLISGLVRGELREMWRYTEADDEEEEADKKAQAEEKTKGTETAKTVEKSDKKDDASNGQKPRGKQIKVGGHSERLYFAFLVSKRKGRRSGGHNKAWTVEASGDEDDLKPQPSRFRANGEPLQKIRRLS